MLRIVVVGLALLVLQKFASAGTTGINHPHHGIDGRIINGHSVAPHSVPHMVAVYSRQSNTSRYIELCGGTLLSDRHIVTAAHCLHRGKSIYMLKFAAHNIFANESFQILRTNATFVIHEDHYKSIFAHDIAMIKLLEPLDMSLPFIHAAKLPDPKDADKTYVNETVEAFGWGRSNDSLLSYMDRLPKELQGVNLTVMPLEDCRSEVHRINPYDNAVYDYDICTSSPNPPKPMGICHGDSGGPLKYNGTLIGVTSRLTTSACMNNDPRVFVSVGKHLEWIKDKMKNM